MQVEDKVVWSGHLFDIRWSHLSVWGIRGACVGPARVFLETAADWIPRISKENHKTTERAQETK